MKQCKCSHIKEILGGDGEDYAREHLVQIGISQDKWETLYKCPDTGIYWKEFSRYPEAQAGGPPDYIQITEEEARKEFNF